MLYKQNASEQLNDKLFENPTSEYRGTPFWAWNCKLDKAELLRQIDVLKTMGFGGFHMHVRSGMATEYLSPEFMDLVKSCTDKAEAEEMLAWLYDEDRWPSGFAGGLVTKDPKYRIRYLLFTHTSYDDCGGLDRDGNEVQTQKRSGQNTSFIAKFDIKLNKDGCLESYKVLDKDEEGENDVWYAYIESPKLSSRYNGYTYANLMDKPTIDRFIKVTHEKYYKTVGDRFGTVVPAIFTDEPQFTHKQTLPFPTSKDDITLPWTDDLPQTFEKAYGEDLVSHIPELVWEKAEGVSVIRYHYHDHACQRFYESFSCNLGRWCEKHGISLTGHMMREPSLSSQTQAVGECMRSLSAFQLPGIDMLSDNHEFTTAKQAASVAHQYGREGVMSELYGVTDWDYDFRGHKLQGDWQAALGVTVRVPHLAWVSMEGEAKRDYPACINYQSPWFERYPLVENHFARLNTALTRGTPDIRIGVIHPVESLWLHWGPSAQTAAVRSKLDTAFDSVTKWLLAGTLDFDYISESLLPSQCKKASFPLTVGSMNYDAIVVPCCETLRKTTVDRLKAFKKAGGRLVFVGDAPKYMDGVASDIPYRLWKDSVHAELTNSSLLDSLSENRTVSIFNADGTRTSNLITQQRDDGNSKWLFVCQNRNPGKVDVSSLQRISITVNGSFSVELYDTMEGTHAPVAYAHSNGKTVINTGVYAHDSLLYKLTPCDADYQALITENIEYTVKDYPQILIRSAQVKTSEPNALLLDICEYALDDEPYGLPEEILRADTALRARLGWGAWSGTANQPWCIPAEPINHTMRQRYTIDSKVAVKAPSLALELAEDTKIYLNGQYVPSEITGYYTDKSIKTVKLPDLPAGRSVLELIVPFGSRTAAERVYLLGAFGVEVNGSRAVITALPNNIGFSDITSQGFPFYGGKITYSFDIETSGEKLEIRVPKYRASCYDISIDKQKPVTVAYMPYSTVFEGLTPGLHRVKITLYINRNNAFGHIHCADETITYPGPPVWRTKGDSFSYEYVLHREGILSAPVIKEFIRK